MIETLASQQVVSPPIRALIIQPDNTYEVREIEQDISTFYGIVCGQPELFSTEDCTFWYKRGQLPGMSLNSMATYLWWLTRISTQEVWHNMSAEFEA